MKGWGELLTYQEQLNGRVDTKGLLRLVGEPEVQVLKCIREPCTYGIFRVITLATCEAAYTFYGAGYHCDKGYIYDEWVFDLDVNAETHKDYISKKSIMVTIKRDFSWYQQKAAKKGKNIDGSLTAFGAIAFPSPLYSGDKNV